MRIALEAGAYGITVHPRPDERHIRRTDVFELAKLVRGEFPGAEYNIEGNPDARFVEIVEQVRPDQVTRVPDDVRQATSNHGWDIAAHTSYLSDVIARLKSVDMRGAIFIDPDPRAPELAARVGPTGSRSLPGCMGQAQPPPPSPHPGRRLRRDRRRTAFHQLQLRRRRSKRPPLGRG